MRADDGRSRPPLGVAGAILSSFRHVNLPPAPGNAGGSRHQSTPARPCKVARVVMNNSQRSDQAIALRRRAARMRRIDGLRRMAEMVQNPLDDGGFLDAGDDTQVPTALPAGLDINREYSLEALCPCHRPLTDRPMALNGSRFKVRTRKLTLSCFAR